MDIIELLAISDTNNHHLTIHSILRALTQNNSHRWALRLFNTNPQLASAKAVFSLEEAKQSQAKNIEYLKAHSTNPLLYLRKKIIGTNSEHRHSNIHYHYHDKRSGNYKTELILSTAQVQAYIDTVLSSAQSGVTIDSKLRYIIAQAQLFSQAKLTRRYLTPTRIHRITKALLVIQNDSYSNLHKQIELLKLLNLKEL